MSRTETACQLEKSKQTQVGTRFWLFEVSAMPKAPDDGQG